MNQKDLVKKLMVETHNALLKTEDANTIMLLQTYQKHLAILIKELEALNSVVESGGKPSIGEWRRLELDKKSAALIGLKLSALHDDVVSKMSSSFMDFYKDAYDRSSWVIDQGTPKGIEVNYKLPTDPFIQEYVDSPWKGDKFSDRIWAVNDKMARQLQSILTTGMQRGDSVQDMASAMRDYTGVPDTEKLISRPRASAQLYRATLIARTEMIRLSRLAQKKAFADNKDVVTDEVWTAAPGFIRVCDDCIERNGRTREWIEENADDDLDVDPPGHPMCRCMYMPVLKPWKNLLGDLGVGMEDLGHIDDFERLHPQTTTLGAGGELVRMDVEPFETWNEAA